MTNTAIAEDPDIRQYILELKGEFSQSQEVEIEEQVAVFKKPRRMSVKRISQEEKDKLTKKSVHDEAFTRRQSLAQQVCQCVSRIRVYNYFLEAMHHYYKQLNMITRSTPY